jgi:hypothetical protein
MGGDSLRSQRNRLRSLVEVHHEVIERVPAQERLEAGVVGRLCDVQGEPDRVQAAVVVGKDDDRLRGVVVPAGASALEPGRRTKPPDLSG